MPWLTPDSIPEDDDCRPLSIPADTVWLALVSGALTELTLSYNWEKAGALTVAETVAKMQEIVDGYYETPCLGCTLPDGGKIIRIGAHGVLEELGSDGEWGVPGGDYIIPPPDAREGGTVTDQNCLAAKNAVNVLEQLYESLSESWDAHLSEAEAGTAFVVTVAGIVGFEFAPITFGIIAFLNVVFGVLYAALEYLGADLWDVAFSDQMTCFLVACASNDAGVVTFDWDCFMAQLNSLADSFMLTELQLRLYLQVTYILYFIGGVDGLNLAAGTTDITNDDCGSCDPHCFMIDLTVSDGSDFGVVISGGTWILGQGIQGANLNSNSRSDAWGYWAFGETLAATLINMTFTKTAGGGGNNINHFQALKPATAYNATIIASDNTNPPGTSITKGIDVSADCDGMGWDVNSGDNTTPLYIEALMVRYTGNIPSGWSDNC